MSTGRVNLELACLNRKSSDRVLNWSDFETTMSLKLGFYKFSAVSLA